MKATEKTRKPAVSGRFYPSDPEELRKLIRELYRRETSRFKELGDINLVGGIVPHAGYVYSGHHAIHFFEMARRYTPDFDTAVIFCPNHGGWGPGVSLDNSSYWSSPLGKVEVDRDFYPYLDLEASGEAHEFEHSAEVMLPMLQYFFSHDFKILPVSIWDQTPEQATTLSLKLLSANKRLEKKLLFIASTDFSHYVSVDSGKALDDRVLEKIRKFDIKGVCHEVEEKNISVCGYGPIMTLLSLGKLLYAHPEFQILRRGHSGEVIPSDEVVHYLSAIVYSKAMDV